MDTAQPSPPLSAAGTQRHFSRHRTGRPPGWTLGFAALLAVALHALLLVGQPPVVVPGSDLGAASLRVRALAPASAQNDVVDLPSPSRVALPVPAAPAADRPQPAARPAALPGKPADPPTAPPAETPQPTEGAASAPTPPTVAAAASAPQDEAPAPPLPGPIVSASIAMPPTSAASLPGATTPPSPWLTEAGEPLPVYATRFAPSQALRYELRRGLLSGSAVLDWFRDDPTDPDARYRLQLLARAAGLAVLTQESQGRFDAAGLMPLRFTDQRLRGPARAANFQPERGLIGFSGPSIEYPWVSGLQDRLSWMLQLPAIVAANPRLAATGERIVLGVIGARGDAAVWIFRFEATEQLEVPGGEVAALKFVREPRKPNDTRAEVWLDPSRHHLPARARLSNPPDGEVFDLLRTLP